MTKKQLEKLAGRKVDILGTLLTWIGIDRAVVCPHARAICEITCPHCAIEQRKTLAPDGSLVPTGQFFASLSCGGEPRSIEIEVDEKG